MSSLKTSPLLKSILYVAGILILFSAHLAHASTTITDCAGLQNIESDLSGDYVLGNNIDCAGFGGSDGFVAITNFTGTLNGNGFAIQNLNMPLLGFINTRGLFSVIDGATIYNLDITDATVWTNYEGGILAGRASNSTIVDVSVSGTIQSTALLSVTGGMVGRLANGSKMYNSSVNVSLSGSTIMGGIAASVNGSTISRSFSTGTLTGSGGADSWVGGIAGEVVNATIDNSYSQMSVSGGTNIVGGLAGTVLNSSVIRKSYSAGAVSATGNTDVGGLVGKLETGSTVLDSYWDTEVSGQASSVGGTGKTTTEMKTQNTFSGWNFSTTWSFTTGNYPTLLVYPYGTPTLTPVTTIPTQTTNSSPQYVFSTPTPGTYSMSQCHAGDQSIDPDAGIVSIAGLSRDTEYSCTFLLTDPFGTESNILTIGPFRIVSSAGSVSSVSGGHSYQVQPTLTQISSVAINQKEAYHFPRILKQGMNGDDVVILQKFFNIPPTATKFFGTKTKLAVMNYQKAHSILPTGILGPKTAASIESQIQ